MPKAKQKTGLTEDGDNNPHGVVNPKEAEAHANNLDLIITNIEDQVKRGHMRGLLDKRLGDIKTTLAPTIPVMETANFNTMAKSIKDRYL